MLRALLMIASLTLFALGTAWPWGLLWLAVPLAVAVSLLACWRFGPWGILVPLSLLALTLLLVGSFSEWAWWIPVAALTGSWMGLREEGGGPASGQRAWMLLPLLLLAAGLPWALTYPRMVDNVNQQLRENDKSAPAMAQRMFGLTGDRLKAMEQNLPEIDAVRSKSVPQALPTLLFLWMALLVVAGRDVSSRIAARLRWPELSRAHLSDWRLPDGAIWLLMIGIGLMLLASKAWRPTGVTLLAVPALGYCVQGIAVVRSLTLARGVPSSIVVLTMFVVFMAFPVFLVAMIGIGLSDIWLDYRRLEAVPEGDSS